MIARVGKNPGRGKGTQVDRHALAALPEGEGATLEATVGAKVIALDMDRGELLELVTRGCALLGAVTPPVMAAAAEAVKLRARHVELCDLMEQRRGGSEAHGEIMSIERKLADLALVMARALVAEPATATASGPTPVAPAVDHAATASAVVLATPEPLDLDYVEEVVQVGLAVQAEREQREEDAETPGMERRQILADMTRMTKEIAAGFRLAREILADLSDPEARTKLRRMSDLLINGAGHVDNDINQIEIEVGEWIAAFEDGRAALSYLDGDAPVCEGIEGDGNCWRLVEKGHAVCACHEHALAHPELYGHRDNKPAK